MHSRRHSQSLGERLTGIRLYGLLGGVLAVASVRHCPCRSQPWPTREPVNSVTGSLPTRAFTASPDPCRAAPGCLDVSDPMRFLLLVVISARRTAVPRLLAQEADSTSVSTRARSPAPCKMQSCIASSLGCAPGACSRGGACAAIWLRRSRSLRRARLSELPIAARLLLGLGLNGAHGACQVSGTSGRDALQGARRSRHRAETVLHYNPRVLQPSRGPRMRHVCA